MTNKERKWRISRRGFLIGFGATAVTATAAVAIGANVGLTEYRESLARDTVVENEVPEFGVFQGFWTQPDTWIEITAENEVKFYSPKIEMGQGVLTALGQVAADELSVAWEDMEIVQADTARGMNDYGGTGGSYSIPTMYPLIREAAATLRELLLQEASRQMGIAVDALQAKDTAVIHKTNADQLMTYGELIQFAQNWEIPEERPTLKSGDQLKMIGQPIPRVDFEAKILGEAVYGYDASRPNMLYGAIARPPTVDAKLRTANEGTAMGQPGVQNVIIDGDFVGVVAESRAQAYAALQQLDLEWDEGKLWQQAEIDELVTVGNGLKIVIQEGGENVNQLLRDDDRNVVSMELRTPFAAHASMEPQAALADIQADSAEVWMSTQAAFRERGLIAEAIGRDPESVILHPLYLGGGFGRRLNSGAGTEAARLSNVAGRPVHVGWSRTEDLQNGFFRPPTHHLLRGKVDENGRIHAIEHETATAEVMLGLPSGRRESFLAIDAGIYRGATILYDVPNVRVTTYKVDLPVQTGPWRGLGLLANTFAVESMIDALAYQAQMDPLAFRLLNLPDSKIGQRLKNVLEAAAEKANWDASLPDGHARGIAISLDVNTVVAEVAEVSEENGRIRVHKMVAAVDPGKVVNPDGVVAQVEGAIMMGLSSTFFEEIRIKDGRVEAMNFDQYPLLTMKEAPAVEVVLLESGDSPYGIGEPPLGPVAAAVGNAYFALTGKRMTQLPMREIGDLQP